MTKTLTIILILIILFFIGYSAYTPIFNLKKAPYRDYGLDTLLNKFSYGRKNKPELYDDNSLLLYIGKSAFEDEKFEYALRIFQFNHKEFPDNKETMDMILKIEKTIE